MERSHYVDAGSLESSLVHLIDDHNRAAIELRKRTDDFPVQSVFAIAGNYDQLMKVVDGGVHDIFINEKRIKVEIQALSATIMRFSKQTDQWLAVSRAMNTAVKEIEDFENWMKTMELDSKRISAAISAAMERSHQVEAGSLEASLLQMVSDHNHAAIELRERTEKAKKEAIQTAIRVSDLLVKSVDGGVREVFINEERIDKEIQALTASITRFSKQNDQWLAASHALNTAVKEIGDFENWMKTMELDCKSISAAICNIYQT
ncbi:hypothetical protein SASPL_156481 [Salvia splendens]|uniref:Biogenesis of lysosome-related organelles complex 1 subunit 1 n=2 Tax=Salvia splendens TaxID=180675 RepID=A0A8X8VWL4_SALSN|nr:hypothetical protein SASPL_156481 [Salvia splendens]